MHTISRICGTHTHQLLHTQANIECEQELHAKQLA